MVELALRLVVSLAIVVGLLLLVVRVAGRRMHSSAGAPVQVLHRQALTRSSGVAVLQVGGRVLVLGTTEQQVSMLMELDPEELAVAEAPADADPADPDTDADTDAEPAASFADHVDVAVRELTVVGGDDAEPRPVRRPAARPVAGAADARGPLAGSVLSPDTWRQAVAAARGRS